MSFGGLSKSNAICGVSLASPGADLEGDSTPQQDGEFQESQWGAG